MKRDMDLIRDILIAIEARESDIVNGLKIDGYLSEDVAYNCSLLYDAGFVKAYKGLYASGKLYSFIVGSLTSSCTEFLEQIRSDTVWNKTKEVIVKKGLPPALDVIKTVVTSIVEGMVKGAIGL